MKLTELLSKAEASLYSDYLVTCPICNNKSCEPGEYVEYVKATPDHCYICGWVEGNGTEAYPGNDEYVEKCWQLQIAPYPDLELKDVEEMTSNNKD